MLYSLVWSAYSVACLVALLCLFWLTDGIPAAVIRWLIRMPFIALCFTPVQVQNAESFWLAPAIAAVALDVLAGNVSAGLQYLPLLLGSVFVALVLGAAIGVLLGKKQ